MKNDSIYDRYETLIRFITLMQLYLSEKKLTLEYNDWQNEKMRDLINTSDIIGLDDENEK